MKTLNLKNETLKVLSNMLVDIINQRMGNGNTVSTDMAIAFSLSALALNSLLNGAHPWGITYTAPEVTDAAPTE